MFVKNIFLFILVALIFSCRNTTTTNEIITTYDSIQNKKTEANSNLVPLSIEAEKEVENWIEYQKFDEFLSQYNHISRSDALFNAKDLSDLAKQLKDSIRIEKFLIPSVKIRLNVLHNETLRLADMATIKTISDEEITQEKENIMNAFSALNLKINNILSQENLNSLVDEFIEEILRSPDSMHSQVKISPESISKQ